MSLRCDLMYSGYVPICSSGEGESASSYCAGGSAAGTVAGGSMRAWARQWDEQLGQLDQESGCAFVSGSAPFSGAIRVMRQPFPGALSIFKLPPRR